MSNAMEYMLFFSVMVNNFQEFDQFFSVCYILCIIFILFGVLSRIISDVESEYLQLEYRDRRKKNN